MQNDFARYNSTANTSINISYKNTALVILATALKQTNLWINLPIWKLTYHHASKGC